MKLRLLLIIILWIGVFFSTKIFSNGYDSDVDHEIVTSLHDTLLAISNNDIEKSKENILPDSRILENEMFSTAVKYLQMVDVESMQISKIEVSGNDAQELATIYVFFNNKKEAWLTAIMLKTNDRKIWKLEKFILNDAYFMDARRDVK